MNTNTIFIYFIFATILLLIIFVFDDSPQYVKTNTKHNCETCDNNNCSCKCNKCNKCDKCDKCSKKNDNPDLTQYFIYNKTFIDDLDESYY